MLEWIFFVLIINVTKNTAILMNAMAKQIRNVYDLLRSSKEALDLDKGSVLPTEIAAVVEPQSASAPSAIKPVEEAQFVPKAESKKETHKKSSGILQKDYVKYPLIFIISFGIFYVALNFGAFFAKFNAAIAPDPEPVAQNEGQVLGITTPEFTAWIGKYFFYANDSDSLSPNNDYDKDGLTNYQEFLLGTNPAKDDTDNDNFSDGQEILNGYNPLYDGKLRPAQEEIIKDWDLRVVNNRISYNAVSKLSQGPAKPSDLPLINYNLDEPAELSIPKLGVKAPVIWSRSPETFDDDLNRGLIHFPGTSFPGQVGVTYISGHSSNYAWRKSDYSYVFTRLNELNSGDEFFVTVSRVDGEKITLRYVVFEANKYKPDDQAQFTASGDDSIVNLSTCWPIGSISERYVVSARLTGA